MYLGVYCQKSEIEEYFANAMTITQTRGIADGYIIRYRTMYLKIYPEPKKESTYIVQEFRYGADRPYNEHVVPRNDLRRFAEQFR